MENSPTPKPASRRAPQPAPPAAATRIRQEVLDEEYGKEDEIIAALDAKIVVMRQREREATRLLADQSAGWENDGVED